MLIFFLTFALSFLFAKFKPMSQETFTIQTLFSVLSFPSLWMKYLFFAFTLIFVLGGTVGLMGIAGLPMNIAGFLALMLVNLMFYKSYKKQALNYG